MKASQSSYFPSVSQSSIPGMTDMKVYRSGITQYAEIAARFHAALLSSELGHQERANPAYAADRAFAHADAFFAELAKRQP